MKILLIAAALASGSAVAQTPANPTGPGQMPDLEALFFQQFDSDRDGRVSKGEFLKPTEAQFDHMDQDKDGMVDGAEVKAFNDEMARRMQEMQRQMQQQGMPR
jgi:Ca2+-binding EF-hand superfamily protein